MQRNKQLPNYCVHYDTLSAIVRCKKIFIRSGMEIPTSMKIARTDSNQTFLNRFLFYLHAPLGKKKKIACLPLDFMTEIVNRILGNKLDFRGLPELREFGKVRYKFRVRIKKDQGRHLDVVL